jgi:hypothetical protein
MGYSDPKFYSRHLVPLAGSASLSTATASGANTVPAASLPALPKFVRRTKVNALQVVCKVIPNAASTALVLAALNGTTTFGTVVLTTATAGQVINGVITNTSTGNEIAAGTGITLALAGTATASGAAMGTFDILAETQELYA